MKKNLIRILLVVALLMVVGVAVVFIYLDAIAKKGFETVGPQLTKGLGSDLSVEAVGIAPTMDDCIASTRRGGRIVVAGAFEQPYQAAMLNLLVQEQSIIGTFGYTAEFTEARDLICSGAVDVSPLISRTVSLDDLPATFEEITQDRNRDQKVLVRP